MLNPDGASTFLLGRLALEGCTPQAMLKAAPLPWRGLAGAHVFAVAGGRLWLAQPRLLGEPAVASVPLGDVGGVTVRPGRAGALRMNIELRRGTLRYTAMDDADACRAFVDALRTGTSEP